MAGRLAIDFGNSYTVAAYWRKEFRQAESLYIPGVTRPILDSVAGLGKRVFAAPSLISYEAEVTAEAWLVGQEAAEGLSGLVVDRKVFSNFQSDVITGKRVYSTAGSRLLSGQDIAKDYLVSVICRAGQALGLASEAVITFTMPAEACQSGEVWQRYRRWLEAIVRQAGYSRLELVEQPWAAAWGAGMPVKSEAVYSVINVSADAIDAVVVQAAPHTSDEFQRHIRVLSRSGDWLTSEDKNDEPKMQLTVIIQQALKEAKRRGYPVSTMTGVVVTGSGVRPDTIENVQNLFAGLPVYAKQPFVAAACGAAALSAGAETCGHLCHSYGLRFLGESGYQYHELVPQGMFYPSKEPVAEFIIKASYDGQQEFALFIYRLVDGGQCINEDSPLILTTPIPAARGQDMITVSASVDSAGQLVITAKVIVSCRIIADSVPAARLV